MTRYTIIRTLQIACFISLSLAIVSFLALVVSIVIDNTPATSWSVLSFTVFLVIGVFCAMMQD